MRTTIFRFCGYLVLGYAIVSAYFGHTESFWYLALAYCLIDMKADLVDILYYLEEEAKEDDETLTPV